LSGDQDPVGNFGKDVKRLYDTYMNIGITDVTLNIYKDDRHEILNELDKENIYEDILKWIYEKIRTTIDILPNFPTSF
ncbi:MAG: hypothetical protein GX818_02970, partial [Tissierellia bacterium]|nr:hypothetical protein [Tissierellia bacterium]